ncbi:TRAP transporter substrate-binding protein [Reyranella sp.]|uniref:TRAP transporter substrate-binding protein n=1 Tax=Reyranella sp. TaxID=1929291 RepID=UPI003BAC1F68
MALLGAPAVLRAQAPLRLPLSTVLPDTNFHTVNCRRFADEVRQATGGAVEIDVKSGGQLAFTGPEQMRAVRDALVPMADFMSTQQAGDEPVLGIEGLPFLAADIEELRTLHRFIRPAFDEVALRNEQTILYVVPWPAQYLHLRVKAETVGALRDIKIRVPDRECRDMAAAIGMAPALIPWAETLPALSSGEVSGVATSAFSAANGKLWEVVKFFHATSQQWSSQIVSINNDSWRRIAADHRQAIMDVARRLEPAFWQSSVDVDAESRRQLAAGGMALVTPSAAMMAELRQRTSRLLAIFMERVPAAEAPLKAYLADRKRA